MMRTDTTRDHAVVLGASVAGLLAARVLSEFYHLVSGFAVITAGHRTVDDLKAIFSDHLLMLILRKLERNWGGPCPHTKWDQRSAPGLGGSSGVVGSVRAERCHSVWRGTITAG
jgi:hypothetical protein